jgi:hypothetical protein
VQREGLQHLDPPVAVLASLFDPRLEPAHQVELFLEETADFGRRAAQGLGSCR